MPGEAPDSGTGVVEFHGYAVETSRRSLVAHAATEALLGLGLGGTAAAALLYAVYFAQLRLDGGVANLAAAWRIDAVLGVAPGVALLATLVVGIGSLLGFLVVAAVVDEPTEGVPLRPVPDLRTTAAAGVLVVTVVAVAWTMVAPAGTALLGFVVAGLATAAVHVLLQRRLRSTYARFRERGLTADRRTGAVGLLLLAVGYLLPDPTLLWLVGYLLARLVLLAYANVVIPLRARGSVAE